MTEPNEPPVRPSEARAREQVGHLLTWAGGELGFSPTARRPCAPDLVAVATQAQGVDALAAAHEELLLQAGGGGRGTALMEIFGSDDVGVDAMIGGLGRAPMRVVALDHVTRLGYDLDEFDVVIRVRPGREVEFVVAGSPNPPVWAFIDGATDPVLRHPAFTEWLRYRVVRSVKRRYPLRRIRPAPGAS